ncbi:MAG: hypothetical protein DRP22_04840 [Verrucomicrobia bacterium]|nr:MAG: hypothetical protein DRP22_04840 [Verrucomicrobiota bacterium]
MKPPREGREGTAGVHAGRPAFIVFGVAAILRLLLVLDYSQGDFACCPILDQLEYVQTARKLAGGEPVALVWRAPLYVHFVAVVFRSGGGEEIAVRVVQAFLSAATAALVYAIGRTLLGTAAGIAAGLAFAVHWSSILYCTQIVPVTLFSFLATAAMYLLCRYGSAAARAAAGFSAGLATLTRPTMIPSLAAWGVWCLAGVRTSPRRALRGLIAFAAAASMVIGPVVYSSSKRAGGAVPLSPLGGYNLFVGNNPESDGKTVWASERALRRAGISVALQPSEYQRRYLRLVWHYVREHPVRETALLLRKCYYLINDYRISSTFDMDLMERNLSLPFRILAGLPFNGIIWPLGILGLAVAGFRDRRVTWVSLFVLSYAATVIIFFVNERLRLPLLPGLIILAAAGIRHIVAATRGDRVRMAVFLVVLLVICNSRLMGVADPRDLVELDIRHAWAFYLAGRVESCREAADRVRRWAPGHPRLLQLERLLSESK